MKRALFVAFLCLSAAWNQLAQSEPAQAEPAQTAPTQTSQLLLPDDPGALRLPHPLGDAFLLRPATCLPGCALVVVSHSRGMNAELSLTRPHLRSLFGQLTSHGYAVLVSNDAGPTTWGAPQALEYLADIYARAVRLFAFSGHTYNFGYSMGGLPALLTAYQQIYPVRGVMLLDAQVNLLDVVQGSNPAFRTEALAAQALSEHTPVPVGRDPYHDYSPAVTAGLPLLIAGSPADQTVAFARNGEALFRLNRAPQSRLLELPGPHLGASHFGEALVGEMLMFLDGLEGKSSPAAVAPAP